MNREELLNYKYLIMGLGISGFYSAKFLIEKGVDVLISDISDSKLIRERAEELKKLANEIGSSFDYKIGEQNEELLKGIDIVILSPGIRPDLKMFDLAKKKGTILTNDIQLFYWFYGKDLIGVTGSNGKSTTVTLLSHILNNCGVESIVAGNIGKSVFEINKKEIENKTIILELSSFQLETMIDFRPKIGVLLNLTPDHLDRHPDFDTYIKAKLNIFKNQNEDDFAILNDILPEYSFINELKSKKLGFTTRGELKNFYDGVFVRNEKIYFKRGESIEFVGNREDINLIGEHNLENFLAAYIVSKVNGINNTDILEGVKGYKTLPHRLEFVGELNGVKFYNDSKATNVDSAIMGVKSFSKGVHLILGGKDKNTELDSLFKAMESRVVGVYLIGEAAERFSNEMGDRFKKTMCVDLKDAMLTAFKKAKSGDVILLSPACASFDMFKNFEDRGERFKEIFKELKESGDYE